jgi:hypothetical protein
MKYLIKAALVVIMGSSLSLHAQRRSQPIEVGITLGASNYMGELSPFIALNETKPMGGIICRFNYSDFITLRGNALFGQISGSDKNYPDIEERAKRNLSFKSDIIEIGGTIEYNIFGYGETQRFNPASPYVFAGISVFKFNPLAYFEYMPDVHLASEYGQDIARFDKTWVELQPLSTEAQETTKFNDRRRYSLTQVSIPIGVGYKAQFDDVWAWGIELGFRKTFTDYLDDISMTYVDPQITRGSNGGLAAAMADRTPELRRTDWVNDYGSEERLGARRGDETNKDWYLFLNFTLTRKITGGKTTCFQF